MGRAGFVLVGGNSSRMGQNKAFLRIGDRTLLDSAAAAVREAAGNVSLIGDPRIYGHLGIPVFADTISGAGPLGGIHAALRVGAEWNLIVACDMPALHPELLAALLHRAEQTGADCVLPEGSTGRLEPLCAVYHRRCWARIDDALARGIRKVADGLSGLRIHREIVPAEGFFHNLNTPYEFDKFLND